MDFLRATKYFDYESKVIQELIRDFKNDSLSDIVKAKAIYLKVRDGWRYNPYQISLNKEKYVASTIAGREEGHCIDKAILLATAFRGLGIPSRLRLAKVTNHIAVERLTERFGTNVLTPHGMVEVQLNGNWLKATPAFNKELCEKCNVAPLEFDGEHDSMFQEFNEDGEQFMEYIEDYGHFDDVPFEFMMNNLQENYPNVFSKENDVLEYRF